jgi:subtilase family serine protease
MRNDLRIRNSPALSRGGSLVLLIGLIVLLNGWKAGAAAGRRQPSSTLLTPEMMKMPIVGRVPAATRLTLTVALEIKNMNGLIEAVRQVSDPKSASYKKYLSPEQFGDQYGATPDDYQKLLDWGKANHLTATAHKNRFVATFDGTVGDIENTLSVHLLYRTRPDGTQFFAPDAEPSLALDLPVEHISGLENFLLPQRAGGSGPGGSYQGTDYRNAYVPGVTLHGAGQTIGIFMTDGFTQSDINGYAGLTNQTFLPVQEAPPNSATSSTSPEGTLDIEMALSMAPKAQIVVFLGTSTAILTNMTDREDIKQFSSSWFWYNGTIGDTTLMYNLAMDGQSFFQASGDSGAYPIGVWPTYISGHLDSRLFPYITIVGSTSLNMNNNGASYGTLETAWPQSSGGIETSVAIPGYQQRIAGQNQASRANRNVPDVSAQGAGGNIFFDNAVTNLNGTSQSTPLWAGFMALVNEQAGYNGQPSIGFANPALYAIASTGAYSSAFNDIVSGCAPDKIGNNNNQYCAGTGYDLVTGLGSPTANLINMLANTPAPPPVCTAVLFCGVATVSCTGSNVQIFGVSDATGSAYINAGGGGASSATLGGIFPPVTACTSSYGSSGTFANPTCLTVSLPADVCPSSEGTVNNRCGNYGDNVWCQKFQECLPSAEAGRICGMPNKTPPNSVQSPR